MVAIDWGTDGQGVGVVTAKVAQVQPAPPGDPIPRRVPDTDPVVITAAKAVITGNPLQLFSMASWPVNERWNKKQGVGLFLDPVNSSTRAPHGGASYVLMHRPSVHVGTQARSDRHPLSGALSLSLFLSFYLSGRGR